MRVGCAAEGRGHTPRGNGHVVGLDAPDVVLQSLQVTLSSFSLVLWLSCLLLTSARSRQGYTVAGVDFDLCILDDLLA